MKLIHNLGLILLNTAHLGASFKIGLDVYRRLAPIAAAERGYDGAVGGEAIAAIIAAVIIYFVLDKLIYYILDMLVYYIKK